ncbi:hypothetical protein RUM43_007548 [Polyplax serrata]|uniref:C-factor n=1 Tax=Polyplax serrata TaxID=468196 RepID=A0AAN8PMR8_POLSC
MKSVVITGCNRGIGLSFVKQLLNLPTRPTYIIATCRDLAKATELNEISEKNSNVHIIEIDVRDFEKYSEFVSKVENIVGDDGVNVLINNAGISSKFSRIALVKVEQMIETLKVNTIAPVMLVKAYLPLLKKAAVKNAHLPMGVSRAAVINISSILGSVENNIDGGYYPYRCSKAALNAATKSLSIDLKNDNILVTSVHPGWCKTSLGGKNAPMEADDSVMQILDSIKKLQEKDNGSFIQYNGIHLPW